MHRNCGHTPDCCTVPYPATLRRVYPCILCSCTQALPSIVIRGQSLDVYRSRGDAVPVVAAYSVVCGGTGAARCVLQTTEVRILAFEDVEAAFAADEGEGDRSLASW